MLELPSFSNSLTLIPLDIAFEATINIEPAEGADPNQFTIPNGEYNEETGWVQDVSRLGVLRAKDSGYEITDFGTGW